MNISIQKITWKDAEELLSFEMENRVYFEQSVPSRGDDYYIPGVFLKRHRDLLQEQSKGISVFYLIRNKKQGIMGRINVVDVDSTSQLGFLGYRVGKEFTGLGVTSRALELLLADIDLIEVHAKTTRDNLGSQRVLEKNGFKQDGNSPIVDDGFIYFVRSR